MGKSYRSRRAGSDPPKPFEFDMDEDTDHAAHFVCDGGVSLLDLSDLAQIAEADLESTEGIAAIAQIFRSGMKSETYHRFAAHTRKHDTDPDVLLEIMKDLVEHVLSGHSRRRSPSPPGPIGTNGGYVETVDWPGLNPRALSDEQVAAIRTNLARGA
jgi:hypothetical protein